MGKINYNFSDGLRNLGVIAAAICRYILDKRRIFYDYFRYGLRNEGF